MCIRNTFVHVCLNTPAVFRGGKKPMCLCLHREHLNSEDFCCSSDSPVSWILMLCSLLSSQACVISPFSILISREWRASCGSSGCNGHMMDTEDMLKYFIHRQIEILHVEMCFWWGLMTSSWHNSPTLTCCQLICYILQEHSGFSHLSPPSNIYYLSLICSSPSWDGEKES